MGPGRNLFLARFRLRAFLGVLKLLPATSAFGSVWPAWPKLNEHPLQYRGWRIIWLTIDGGGFCFSPLAFTAPVSSSSSPATGEVHPGTQTLRHVCAVHLLAHGERERAAREVDKVSTRSPVDINSLPRKDSFREGLGSSRVRSGGLGQEV